MLSCVCRPVNSSLPKPPLAMAPQKRPPIVVTCEPRIATATIVTKKVNLHLLFYGHFFPFDLEKYFHRIVFVNIFFMLCDFSFKYFFFFVIVEIYRQ